MSRGVIDHLADQTHYVYEAWMGDVPLYVGLTCDLGRRLGEHRAKHWWGDVTRFEVTVHPDRPTADAVERQRIRDLLPAHNVCGVRGYTVEYPEDGYDETRDLSPEDFALLRSALDSMFAGAVTAA